MGVAGIYAPHSLAFRFQVVAGCPQLLHEFLDLADRDRAGRHDLVARVGGIGLPDTRRCLVLFDKVGYGFEVDRRQRFSSFHPLLSFAATGTSQWQPCLIKVNGVLMTCSPTKE